MVTQMWTLTIRSLLAERGRLFMHHEAIFEFS